MKENLMFKIFHHLSNHSYLHGVAMLNNCKKLAKTIRQNHNETVTIKLPQANSHNLTVTIKQSHSNRHNQAVTITQP